MKLTKRIISFAALCLPLAVLPLCSSIQADAAETICAEIPVECSDVPDDTDHVYLIRIEPESEDAPLPVKDTLEIAEDGTESFEIELDSPGTFYYKIYESVGDKEGIEYDTNVYTIAIYVVNDEGGGLRHTIVANVGENDSKSDEITFADLVLDPSKKGQDHVLAVETATEASAGNADELITSAASVTSALSAVSTSGTAAAANAGAGSGNSNGDRSFTGFVESVLTGDSFPAHTLRIIMLAAFLTAAASLFLKHRNSEEVEENEK